MITKAQAIKAINPNAEFVIRDGVVESVSEGITDEQITAKQTELQTEYDNLQYQRLREPEYPKIGNQLDALLKHLNYRRTQGDELVQELDDIISSWLSVKQRFPKND